MRFNHDVLRTLQERLHPLIAWIVQNVGAIRTYLLDQRARETEFQPAALEIVDSPPSPLARGVALVIVALVLVALVWASLGRVDIIAIAPGRIIPSSRVKQIQPLEAGVVRKLHVGDGQMVKAGDVLIEIDPTINEAEQKRIQKEYAQAALDVARLTAIRFAADGPVTAFLPPPGADPSDVTVARNLMDSQVREIRARIAALASQIDEKRSGTKAVDASIDKLSDGEAIARQKLSVQYADVDRLATVQEVSSQHKEIAVQQMRREEQQNSIAGLQEQRHQAIAEYRRDIEAKLSDAQRKVTLLSEQLVQANQRTRLQTLKAPVDGTIQQLAIHTEGGVVTPAQVLLVVVPRDSVLEIEANVSNKDIGFVTPGQTAEIKIDTFNFTRYGLLEGTVTSISQDAIMREVQAKLPSTPVSAPPSAPAQELTYTARIALATDHMMIDGKPVRLAPGMAITAEIRTGTRRIIDYLLSPLARAHHDALRER